VCNKINIDWSNIMFEDKDREIPEVEFTFEEEQKDEEERNKEIEELIKKRNELLSSMGIEIPQTSEDEPDEKDSDYPRHRR
jgi:hypothetical protein